MIHGPLPDHSGEEYRMGTSNDNVDRATEEIAQFLWRTEEALLLEQLQRGGSHWEEIRLILNKYFGADS